MLKGGDYKMVVPQEREEDIGNIMRDDEFLKALEEHIDLTSILSYRIIYLNPGRRFKQIFLLEITNGERTEKIVVKFYKRNNIKRFNKEVSYRDLDEINGIYAPKFIWHKKNNNKSKGAVFEKGDYLVFVEQYIEGKTLLEIIDHDDGFLDIVEICESVYEEIGELTQSFGWSLSNVNPRNIIVPLDGKKPVVVDWGGRAMEVAMDWYRELIATTILAPAMLKR